MPSRSVTVRQPVGLHARPAARFVRMATQAACSVTVAKSGGQPVRADSILQVITLDVRQGDEIVLTADGTDAAQTLDALVELVSAEDG